MVPITVTIFNVIVCGDLISYTCIISDTVLDHDKKFTVTGIGARKYTVEWLLNTL